MSVKAMSYAMFKLIIFSKLASFSELHEWLVVCRLKLWTFSFMLMYFFVLFLALLFFLFVIFLLLMMKIFGKIYIFYFVAFYIFLPT